jgi:uncharacterized protein YaaN involved in tellurite resistance
LRTTNFNEGILKSLNGIKAMQSDRIVHQSLEMELTRASKFRDNSQESRYNPGNTEEITAHLQDTQNSHVQRLNSIGDKIDEIYLSISRSMQGLTSNLRKDI